MVRNWTKYYKRKKHRGSIGLYSKKEDIRREKDRKAGRRKR